MIRLNWAQSRLDRIFLNGHRDNFDIEDIFRSDGLPNSDAAQDLSQYEWLIFRERF